MRILAAAFAALVLAGCAGRQPAADGRRLELSVDPAPPSPLPSGTIVKVAARALPPVEMAWVSGTVKMLGAPVLGMKPDADGKTWRFRTMVPPMVTVPTGKYEIKAWGRSKAGEDLQGSFSYEVK